MKWLPCMALSFFIVTGPASAQETARETAMQFCMAVSDFAHAVMRNRQNGTPMSKVMEEAAGERLHEELIVEAYSRPRYSSKEMRERQVLDFENEVYGYCFKGVPKN